MRGIGQYCEESEQHCFRVEKMYYSYWYLHYHKMNFGVPPISGYVTSGSVKLIGLAISQSV